LRAVGVPRRLAAKIIRDGFCTAMGNEAAADLAEIEVLVQRLETATANLKESAR